MGAREVLSKQQKLMFIALFALIVLGLIVNYKITIISVLSILTFFYFVNILISAYITYKSLLYGEEIEIDSVDLADKPESFWPKYTILCPLYKEANILKNYVANMAALDYPKNKLECLLLLEEDDLETIEIAKNLELPGFFTLIIIQGSYPKTKPRACNIGLEYATGDYIVIYDAEDRPDKDQLKKAVLLFENSGQEIGCIQAKLNYYNPTQNFLTKMFTSEYSLWFDLILPGLQAINAPIPLGGTSNHFRTKDLKQLGGWDAYNVTEDCDLGIRLKEAGYKTLILKSTTWEEANSEIKNWIRQRSRWVKGYFQTFLVHTRKISYMVRKMGFLNFLYFALLIGFLPVTCLINPFLWITTISYFAFRPVIGSVIEQFYPPYLLYPAVLCLVLGNFLYVYNYLIGTSKRGFDNLTKYGLLMPVYWIMISIAGWYAILQLILKPHYWEKTKHGLYKEGAINA